MLFEAYEEENRGFKTLLLKDKDLRFQRRKVTFTIAFCSGKLSHFFQDSKKIEALLSWII